MDFLDVKKIRLEKTETGFLNAVHEDGSVTESVHCVPLFPLSDPEGYVSIVFKKSRDFEEVGVIRSLKELSQSQRELAREDIRFRYFIPEIEDVKKVGWKHGLYEWDVVTERGEKVFYLMNRRQNMSITEDGIIVITDVEKCRYRITDHTKLPPRARAELEKVLP